VRPAETPGAYARLLGRIEGAEVLDAAVYRARPLAAKLTAKDRVRSVLHGDATGIPLHAILTDLPFGAWWMAVFLDLFPDAGSRTASTRLVGLGIASTVPTALAGWAEWSLADQPTRRVGIVHAAANGVATAIYVASWAARIKGRHRLGVQLGRAGTIFLLVSGFLGGHMGSGRRATPHQEQMRQQVRSIP
jgi:hypothetical protein